MPASPTTFSNLRALGPGLFLSSVIALAAVAVADRYDAPAMLFALLIGMALSHLNSDAKLRPGLDFAASTLLKAGVAVLGLTISIHTFEALGLWAVLLIVGLLFLTLMGGIALGRALGWDAPRAAIAAGAVAICGASAALAISSVVDPSKKYGTHLLAVILVATGLSTLSMIFYPVLLSHLHVDVLGTGFVLGASIHDVAQVIGAGFSVSDEVGEAATLTKMVRVAMLPIVLLALTLTVGRGEGVSGGKIRLPWFVLVFSGLFVFASIVDVPEAVSVAAKSASRIMFYVAVAAIGLNSKVQEIAKAGHQIIIVLVACSSFLLLGSIAVAELLL